MSNILDPNVAIVDHGVCFECENCGKVYKTKAGKHFCPCASKPQKQEENMSSKVVDLLTDLHKKADIIIKQNQDRPTIPICGFCGKQQNEVFFLIAGYKAMICDECVANCVPMVEERKKAVGLPPCEDTNGTGT